MVRFLITPEDPTRTYGIFLTDRLSETGAGGSAVTPRFPGLAGKTAIVTGASSGIGLATARLLAENGVKVTLVARYRETLEKVAATIPGSHAIPADMTQPAEIKEMVRQAKRSLGRIDILVNNAGQGYQATVEQAELATFRHIYELNVIGPLLAMQEVIPVMRAQGGGSIVNISSGTVLMHQPGISPYSSSKRALTGISMAARLELAPDKIVVTTVYPYLTRTPFYDILIRSLPVPERERMPQGPVPPDTPEYIAEKIAGGIVSGEAEVFAHEWMREWRTRTEPGMPGKH